MNLVFQLATDGLGSSVWNWWSRRPASLGSFRGYEENQGWAASEHWCIAACFRERSHRRKFGLKIGGTGRRPKKFWGHPPQKANRGDAFRKTKINSVFILHQLTLEGEWNVWRAVRQGGLGERRKRLFVCFRGICSNLKQVDRQNMSGIKCKKYMFYLIF